MWDKETRTDTGRQDDCSCEKSSLLYKAQTQLRFVLDANMACQHAYNDNVNMLVCSIVLLETYKKKKTKKQA